MAVGNVVDISRGCEEDPLASVGDPAELRFIICRGAFPDVQHCVLRNLSSATKKHAVLPFCAVLLCVCHFICLLYLSVNYSADIQ